MNGPQSKSLTPFNKEQLKAYAAVSGDDNLIHYDDECARAAGFDGVVVHGMLSMAVVGNYLKSVFPEDAYELVKFSVRFRKVLYPGDELVCTSTPVESGDPVTTCVELELKNGRGELVFGGSATVRRI